MASSLPPTIPTVDELEADGQLLPPADSFVMLSKPTLDLTFEDMKAIAEDLRAKRKRFLQGQLDRPDRKRLPEATPEEKEARGAYVAGLIGGIKI